MITVQQINAHSKKLGSAYEHMLKPLCRSTGLPHTALSILLFVANNPDLATARDFCELRGFKRSLVSAHVERLVCEGYLERRAVPADRRVDALVCTPQADHIVQQGRAIQEQFARLVLCGLSDQDIDVLQKCFCTMDENIDRILKHDDAEKEIPC